MTLWLLLLLTQSPDVSLPAAAAPRPVLSLPQAVELARQHSPHVAAARAQAEGAAKAARLAGRLADPTLELRVENWRPGAADFVASSELDETAVLTQPLDLFTRRGRRAQALGASAEAAAAEQEVAQGVTLDTVARYLEHWRGGALVEALAAQSLGHAHGVLG